MNCKMTTNSHYQQMNLKNLGGERKGDNCNSIINKIHLEKNLFLKVMKCINKFVNLKNAN